MKNNRTILNIVAITALFASGSLLSQSDTVRVRTTTAETVSTGTRPVEPAPVATVAPAPAPAPVAAPAPATTDNTDDHKDHVRKTELGFRYYPTFSALRVRTYDNQVVDGQMTMSNGFGVFVGHNFNHHVGLILELDYNQVSQKYKDRNLDRRVNINYINVPVLLSLNTDKAKVVNWNFVAGPQFGLNIGSDVTEAPGDTVKYTVAVKGGDVGLAYGTGLEIALNREHTVRLDFGYRGFSGLVDMGAKQTSSTSNSASFNVLVSAKRNYHAGYVGLTFLF